MVQVQVREGILEGERVENEFGGSFYSFKGIPFAEPPLGDLRFKAPQPPKPWEGVRSAKAHGPKCFQVDIFLGIPPAGSEDCLYLNVYTPEVKPAKPLPVMVWIHGGAFLCGSGDDILFGPEFLIKHDVIVVTINYRLGALGFLCLDTEDIPGNAGMKDQVAALRWVKKNISNFGGDSENITIFGESAGGASVTYHLMSPITKGLFKRAITQSGAATNPWSQPFEPRQRALALARKLGCESDDDKQLYEFFKAQPLESLINIQISLTLAEEAREFKGIVFGVVSEKQFGDQERFFYGDVFDVVRDGIHEGVDVISGYCADEGVLGLTKGLDIDNVIKQANTYPEVFAPAEIVNNCSKKVVLEVGTKLKANYFGNNKVTNNNIDLWKNWTSMSLFTYGIFQWQKLCSTKNKVYTYKFECLTERNYMGRLMGTDDILGKPTVGHADDLAYLFPMKVMNMKVDQNSETFKIIDTITKLWTNFAKTGNPTPDSSLGAKWTPYSRENQVDLHIGNTLNVHARVNKELEFWENIFREYLPNHVASQIML